MKEYPIRISKTTIQEVAPINDAIPEFQKGYLQKFFKEGHSEKKNIILLAECEGKKAGYLIAYDRFEDGSIYLWCVGVLPKYRKRGLLNRLMKRFEKWSAENGFTKIKLKSTNKFRNMLAYILEEGYLFTQIVPHEDLNENEIWVEKEITIH